MGTEASLSRLASPQPPAADTDLATKAYVDSPFLPVANGTHFNGNAGYTSTNLPQARCRQTRKLLRVLVAGAEQLQVEWANIYTSTNSPAAGASAEIPGPNSVAVRMAIEYPAGQPRQTAGSTAWNSATAYAVNDQVTYGGSSWLAIAASTNSTPADGSASWRRVRRYLARWSGDDGAGTITFAPGDYRQSLPIPLAETTIEGDMIAVLGVFDTGASTNRMPFAASAGACNTAPFVDWVVDLAGGMPAAGASLADTGVTTQTNGNTTTANNTDNATWMKIPYATAVTGRPVYRCVGLVGDSLISGSGGDVRDGEPAGLFVRALDGVSWWRIAQAGNRAGCYRIGNAPWQMACAARCTALITNLGMNDLTAGFTVAQVKANMLAAWRALADTGRPVYAGYLTPISASTDGWTTVANQSRYTNNGVLPTTQFPGDDATYLTSVYGQVALWLSQDGGVITLDSGASVKVGQLGHPVEALLEWRSMMADPATSWKWLAAYTTDGAHPGAAGAPVQAAYLTPQLDAVLLGRQIPAHQFPRFTPEGQPPIANRSRSDIPARSTVATGSTMTVIGVSPGRWFYGVRLFAGTNTAKVITVLAGADAAKLKVVGSNTLTPSAADTVLTLGFASATWIPAGYLIAVVATTPAASAWGGAAAVAAAAHVTGTGFLLAGTSADTIALTGTVSLFNAAKFSPGVFRAYGEAF